MASTAQPADPQKVTYHKGLVTINRFLNGINSTIKSGNQKLPINHAYKGTVNGLIKQTDAEFKVLKPTEKTMILTRGINNPRDINGADGKLVEKQKQLKKGDIMMMKGYAYAASKESSNPYLDDRFVSIAYEIEVPPKARISTRGTDEFIFPRCSKFEVLDNKVNENNVNIIKMRYLLPE